MRRSLAISLALHGAILAALAFYTAPPRPVARARDEAVEVVLVRGTGSLRPQPSPTVSETEPPPPNPVASREQPSAAAATQAPKPERIRPDPRTSTGKAAPRMRLTPKRRQRDLVEATTLYSTAALASPLGRATLAQLETADREERIVQLCNYEAVEQTRRENPKLRIDHARVQVRKEATISGLHVTAPGAAVHGHGLWYDLSFTCDVAPDLAGVEGFAFALGGQIPRAEVEQLDLPTGGPMH